MLSKRIIEGLVTIRDGLLMSCRLEALALLGTAAQREKLARAQAASARAEQAALVQQHLERHFGKRASRVGWPDDERPDRCGLIDGGGALAEAIAAAVERVEREVASCVSALDDAAADSALPAPSRALLAQIAAVLPRPGVEASRRARSKPPAAPTQVLRGPRQVPLDPVFERTFRLLDGPQPTSSEDPHERSPELWCLSTREAMASELACLCIVEYDGLPLEFYRDFAKQAWDEARHAVFFFDAAVEVLPDFLAHARPDHPLLPGARRFAREGRGLPVAREGGLYEVAWNASLEERLVLMHIDTEGPAVPKMKHELLDPFFLTRPRLARDLELTLHDEATHARIGRRWLSHLVPDPRRRAAMCEEARLMRGLYIADALAAHDGVPLVEVIARLQPRSWNAAGSR